MAKKPSNIQIVFVDSNGKTNDGPLILISQELRSKRKLDDSSWTRDQTIRRFCKYLGNEDSDGMAAAIRALNRLDCWGPAISRLKTGPSPNIAKGRALLSFWNEYGLHSIGRGLRDNLPCLVDVFRYLLPPYTGEGLILYRGEVEFRHTTKVYGISWTPIFEKAKVFADRRWPDEGRGVVLKIEATPDIVVTAVKHYSEHTLKLGEDEYIVDPRLIDGKGIVVYQTPDETT
jgi:hypothetical protein